MYLSIDQYPFKHPIDIFKTIRQILYNLQAEYHTRGWLYLSIGFNNIGVDSNDCTNVILGRSLISMKQEDVVSSYDTLHGPDRLITTYELHHRRYLKYVSYATDIGAVGILAFYMLNNRFPDPNEMSPYSNYCFKPDMYPDEIGIETDEFTDMLTEFFRKMLPEAPDARYQSALDAIKNIDMIIEYLEQEQSDLNQSSHEKEG